MAAGRIVVITGAAGGVGQIVTKRWLDAGASVLAVDAHNTGHQALQTFVGPTDRLATHVADLTTEPGARSIVDAARSAFGADPDTLLHLVGGFGMGPLDGEDAASTWQRMLDLNLNSSFHCFRAMIPALKARGGGWMVAMGSKAVGAPPAQMAAYTASKAGLAALVHSASEEFKGDGIHINLILASTIDTPANRAAMGEKAAAKWVSPQDIAEATLFLCSERAKALYGTTLEVYALS